MTAPSVPPPVGAGGDLAVIVPAAEVIRNIQGWHLDVRNALAGRPPEGLRAELQRHADLLDGLVLYPPERAHATVVQLPPGVDPDAYAWALTRAVLKIGLIDARVGPGRITGNDLHLEVEQDPLVTDLATAAQRALAAVRDEPARPVPHGWRPLLPVAHATNPSATMSLLEDLSTSDFSYRRAWRITEARLAHRTRDNEWEILHRVPLGPRTWGFHSTEMSVACRRDQLAELVATQGLGLADPLDGWEAQIELHSGQPATFSRLMDIVYALATVAHIFDRAHTRGEPTPIRTGRIPVPALCLAALALYVAGVEHQARSLQEISLFRPIDLLEHDAQARVVATLDPGNITSTRGRLRPADRTALTTAADDDPDTWKAWRRTAIHIMHVPIAQGISCVAGGVLGSVVADGAPPPWGWYEHDDHDPYLDLNLDA